VTFAITNNFNNLYFTLDKAQAKQDRLWLDDAMRNLIIMVLTNDPKLNGDVQREMRAQLDNLMSDYNIDKNEAAEVAAAEVVTKISELTKNAAANMSTILMGFKELGKLDGFKSPAATVNSAINRLEPASRRRLLVMKGCIIVVVVGRPHSLRSPWRPLFSGVGRLR
jgi:hypothetical protein